MAEAALRLRPGFAVFRARFLTLLQYRAAALAGVMTQLWWGAMKIMVLAAFFLQTSGQAGVPPQPMTLTQAITYVWLGQAFFTLLPWSADPDVKALIRTGNVACEGLRPLDLYWFWWARAAALRTAPPLLRAGPVFVLSGVLAPVAGLGVWGLQPPAGIAPAALFAASLIFVVLLSAAMTMLLNIGALSMLSARGLDSLAFPLVSLLSGMVIPLQLAPGWLQTVLFFQPFAGLVDIPYRIYFGDLTAEWAAAGIACQAGWTAALIILGRMTLRRAMTRLEIQGG